MKHRRILLVPCLAALVLGACSDSSDVKAKGKRVVEEAGEAWDALLDYGYAQRDDLAVRLERDLDQLKRETDDLRARMAEVGADARESLRQELDALEPKLEKARAVVEQARNASAEAWDKARTAAVESVRDLRRKVDSATDEESR